MQVRKLDPPLATVEISGVSREVNIELLEDVKEDDYVIVHAGYAIEKLQPEEAMETLELIKQVAAAGQEELEELKQAEAEAETNAKAQADAEAEAGETRDGAPPPAEGGGAGGKP
jgi:hydrogenase expression/formation protein HypC